MDSACTILLVDDDPTLIAVFATVLRHSGYTVLTAGSAKQAREMLRDHAFSAIITDLHMPHAGRRRSPRRSRRREKPDPRHPDNRLRRVGRSICQRTRRLRHPHQTHRAPHLDTHPGARAGAEKGRRSLSTPVIFQTPLGCPAVFSICLCFERLDDLVAERRNILRISQWILSREKNRLRASQPSLDTCLGCPIHRSFTAMSGASLRSSDRLYALLKGMASAVP